MRPNSNLRSYGSGSNAGVGSYGDSSRTMTKTPLKWFIKAQTAVRDATFQCSGGSTSSVSMKWQSFPRSRLIFVARTNEPMHDVCLGTVVDAASSDLVKLLAAAQSVNGPVAESHCTYKRIPGNSSSSSDNSRSLSAPATVIAGNLKLANRDGQIYLGIKANADEANAAQSSEKVSIVLGLGDSLLFTQMLRATCSDSMESNLNPAA